MKITFSDMVERAFHFLENSGFRLTSTDGGLVRYESDRSFLTVSWESRSGELNVFVGPVRKSGGSNDEYALAEILGVAGLPEYDCRPAQVADEGKLGPFIEKLASAVLTHAQLGLAGDRMYFRRLEAFRSAKAEAYMRELKLRQLRVDVEKAWRDRQFQKVISLYAPVQADLTESELRRLDYARRHEKVGPG